MLVWWSCFATCFAHPIQAVWFAFCIWFLSGSLVFCLIGALAVPL
jgi:hypothetical protein